MYQPWTDVSGLYLDRHHGVETISAMQSCTEQRIHCSGCHDCSGADSLCVDGALLPGEPRDVWPSVQSCVGPGTHRLPHIV